MSALGVSQRNPTGYTHPLTASRFDTLHLLITFYAEHIDRSIRLFGIFKSSSFSSNLKSDRDPSIKMTIIQARPEIWRKDDDWSNVKEREGRKKRQNRVNQRAYRKRHEKTDISEGKSRPFKVERFRITDMSDALLEDKAPPQVVQTLELLEERNNSLYVGATCRQVSGLISPISPSSPTMPLVKIEMNAQELFESFAVELSDVTLLSSVHIASVRSKDPPTIKYPIVFPISSDHLIHLIHYNVYRAFITNKRLVKTQATVTKLNSGSTYQSKLDLCSGISYLEPKEQASLPFTLMPTILQRKVPHLPWLDMFPYPRLRDNLIARQYEFNQLDLCNDLWGEWFISHLGDLIAPRQADTDEEDDVTAGRTGLIVWGESWDPNGWEITMNFVRKWPWVLQGCEELFTSTNYWRAKRELAPLDFSALQVPAFSPSTSMDGTSGSEGYVLTPSWEEVINDQQGKVLSLPRITGFPTVSD
jgi:hypothetical protein